MPPDTMPLVGAFEFVATSAGAAPRSRLIDAEELDSVWRKVFDGTKTVAAPAAEDGAPAAKTAPTAALRPEQVEAPRGATGIEAPLPDRAPQAAAGRVGTTARGTRAGDGVRTQAGDDAGDSAERPAAVGHPSSADVVHPTTGAPPTAASRRASSEPHPVVDSLDRPAFAQPDAGDESVHVSHLGDGLHIVVGNSKLAPHLALRAALETAQWLTGTRTALRKLTLNGATVFDASTAAPDTPDGASFMRPFSC
jgi:hypothetical protein